ncbi:MAG: flagellar motor switch protein FliN [Planctomycetes bacterium]|nr:flagellar motor switch protein FliN [Planctomycetota bacterium]
MARQQMTQGEIDQMLQGGKNGPDAVAMEEILGTPQPLNSPAFQAPAAGEGGDGGTSIEMLYDVEMEVKIELGRAHMLVEDILRLKEGSVIQLEKDSGSPVDILINDRLVAFGEVLVLNDCFCVRVTEILSDADRAIHKR